MIGLDTNMHMFPYCKAATGGASYTSKTDFSPPAEATVQPKLNSFTISIEPNV